MGEGEIRVKRTTPAVIAAILILAVFALGGAGANAGSPKEPQSSRVVSATNEKKNGRELDPSTLPVEFRGGSKVKSPTQAGQMSPSRTIGTMASGSVYVAIDAGHGRGYGSECTSGCFTGYSPGAGYIEDEMNKKVAIRLYSNLDASADFYPAVSRWVQNNDREAADWDWYAAYQPESGKYAGDHMFLDSIPYTDNPDTSWTLNGCEGQPSTCKDNKRSTLYDRAGHANGLSTGTALHGKILVSLHFDSGSGDGPTVWVQEPSTGSTQAQYEHSVALGKAICARIYTLRFGTSNNCSTRAFTGNFAVLREAVNTLANDHAFPVVIIEMANLASSNDRAWLGTGSTQDTRLNQIGDAVYNGIVDWHNANN